MSQLALQSAQATVSTSAAVSKNNPFSSASASASTSASTSTTPTAASSSTSTTPAFVYSNRASSPSDVPFEDSPTVGRIIHTSATVPSLGSFFSSSGLRSPRPTISSPLSATASSTTYSPANPSPQAPTFPLRQSSAPTPQVNQIPQQKTARERARQTSFYSDSSDSESPEPTSPRLAYPSNSNESRTVTGSVISQPSQGSIPTSRPAMAGPVAAAQAESSKALPRNSSIDSAISVISTKSGPSGIQDGQHGASDIAHLIKTAGSPEALIQYLLKEKHSQSQQNSQLWRLVDKQRAMILGLNKDLERSLKDKEKYRKKLKEVMALPAVSAARGIGKAPAQPSGAVPRLDIGKAREPAIAPDSPVLDSDSPKASPVDITMAPYPITPPADQPNAPPSAVDELLNPASSMPKPQDHALNKFDHEAEERAADRARTDHREEQPKEIPYNVSIPPSRSLPSEPPKMPPPKPPVGHLPTVSIVEATPTPDEGLSQFPQPPPRKPPPAPLLLNQDRRPKLAPSPEDGDTESDYDDILEVDEIIIPDRRGRRRTREEDNQEREIIAIREAAVRSASKKSKSSKPSQPGSPRDPLEIQPPSSATASLGELLSEPKIREIPAPLLSPGLPASPHPLSVNSPPLSPRGAPFAAAPLSPRPPRQPIPLPPNTPLATPAVTPARTPATANINEESSSSQADITAQTGAMGNADQQQRRRLSPTERTVVYKGLVTEEYPDILLPPNALPSIEVKVASSRMKPSRASMMSLTQLEEDPVFTLAIISRADNGELWRAEKDIASLTKLDQRLRQFSSYHARLPERSLFNGHAPAKLDVRRTALEQYMDDLLNTPFDTNTALEVCKYLSSHVVPPNSDDAGSIDSGSDANQTRTGPDGRPRRSGYLTKRGKNFGGWKARFFVLDGPLLKYFETPGGAHLGTIKLQNSQVGKQSQSNDNQPPSGAANGEDLDNQYRHAFLILEPKKKDSTSHVKHVLCAESDTERDRWVEALLQWIDYRDPNDPEAPAARMGHAHDRQTQASDRAGVNKVRKPPHRAHHPSDSDTLIGVRYDATQAGDAPQLAPARPKTSGGMPDNHTGHGFEGLSSQASKLISRPKDPQPISDSAAWGNKSGLSLPTSDEKKQRKRSFFGFGPKTRTSSEDQTSLFGGSETGSNSTPPQNSYQGPIRQAFGAPLAEAVRYSSPTDVNVPLPAVVYRCIQYLDHKNAVLEEGIFRLSGSNVVIKQLRERFNTEGDVNLVTDQQYHDIHAIASLLKLYLRELPTTILTRDLHLEFLSTLEFADHTEKIAALNELVQRLPQANATLLKYLIGFLIKIINNSDVNKMTVRNVGIVFSPTLNIPAPVFAVFLQNYEGIFGIDPEVYELPSPVSEPDLHNRFMDAPPRFELPQRPSTSGSASPHGQTRKDSVRELQRSTPTPPLLANNPAMRASPPAVARQGYEPAYAGQPSSGSIPENRQAPDSGHDVRLGYDRRLLQASHKDGGGSASNSYDQSYTPSRRRESAIFMGGIVGPQHQTSRSRLREETRF